jgi:hypothetical protein
MLFCCVCVSFVVRLQLIEWIVIGFPVIVSQRICFKVGIAFCVAKRKCIRFIFVVSVNFALKLGFCVCLSIAVIIDFDVCVETSFGAYVKVPLNIGFSIKFVECFVVVVKESFRVGVC